MEQFLATAAHDLRSPVTAAVLGIDLAQLRVKRLAQAFDPPHDDNQPSGQHDIACGKAIGDALTALNALDNANQAVKRLSRLIGRLFDVSQAKTGKLEIRPMACDLADVVRGSVGTQRALTPGRVIRLDLPTDERVPIIADADRLEQVVTNLLNNALKYSQADRPVDVVLEVNGRHARVAVRDEGPGLPQEEQDHVWELFHRVPGLEVQSGASESLGLGLFICKAIIERHAGQVGVESVVGKGSTFWFVLPLASAIA
jgi:signal transduction histidine kinase